MSNPEIRIKEPLCSILTNKDFDHFTVLHLRDVYLEKLGNSISAKQARLQVYSQVLALHKKGLLVKEPAKSARNSIYSKTALFTDNNVTPRQNITDKPSVDLLSNINLDDVGKHDDSVKKLKESLKTCKVDLLSSIAESEEYMQLINAFPEARDHLQDKYRNTCEQSSKLLGKMKALKTLLVYLLEVRSV